MRFHKESLQSSSLGFSIRCSEITFFGRMSGNYEVCYGSGIWRHISRDEYMELKKKMAINIINS